jgi:hypothetical protein
MFKYLNIRVINFDTKIQQLEESLNEKKDRCYYAVKARYKVWPSAYASGALVKCRKGKAFKKKK